ncbi:HK97-gp10 family putative phage morphogenesis protein [Aliarcobacter butzleri]
MSISANIDGKSLLKALSAFPKNIQKNVMTGATRAAANVVRDRARELVPKRTKNLAKSIVSIQQKAESGQIKFSVTPSRSGKYDGWYAHFIEFGTVKMSAKPFMRPAMEQTQDESLNAAKEYIAKRIPEEIMRSK